MNFSLHGSGSGATTSDGSGRVTKWRRNGQHDGDEVGMQLFCLWVVVRCAVVQGCWKWWCC
jgi:hypothetical protein